ncbi:tetratricopeptide repeat protein [Dysgonomonas sp. 511]|uniref:tetratricopeptide repeat protein n=1 Tax=Dysgonomonas sp. 511 TaxID=2302930 RepID=UPI0013D0E6D8|nr:tetratricopeptide repeat protein [Dysgonomonas sp. 511]NDV77501.1 tetratricopeptide repeat protein [Dysgonomonas sp. 511]
MKLAIVYISFLFCVLSSAYSQTLAEAKQLYLKGEYAKALPVFETEYQAKPADPNLNHWYGVCLFETGGNLAKAEECLLVASQKNIQDSFYYLGQIYTLDFRFTEAASSFDKYETMFKKQPRRKKDDIAKYDAAMERLEGKRSRLSRLRRMAYNTEDIQIIDSIVVDKTDFLSAYKMSHSSGRLEYFNKVFNANRNVNSTVYFNEKENKIYYGQPDSTAGYTLFSMEKLLKDFGNEKKLSSNNFGLTGDVNHPFMMADGVTIYFAAKDEDSLGGYDLFVSRYNMNNDSFLTPERLNMPFNSICNDYMMVIDEEKGVGWFATDRDQPDGKVCIYTFIPNQIVKILDNTDEKYIAGRARISSIKNSWQPDADYSSLITLARKSPKEETKQARDFEFVINDQYTYYMFTDFRNEAARDIYFNVIQLKAKEKELNEELSRMRIDYSSANEERRSAMSTDLLIKEKELEQLQKDIPLQEIQARNAEIQSFP